MIKVLSAGDQKHRLEDAAGTQVGWINGRSIGFRGFRTEEDSRAAAAVAWQALDSALQRQYSGSGNRRPALDRLVLIHDGAYEWFSDGVAPVARLLRPHRRAYDGTYGIELVLPTYANEGVAITAACAVASAVRPYREAEMHHVDRPVHRADHSEPPMPVPL
jgi:hypothetical protein